MTIYEQATMLAGQFALCLIHNLATPLGAIIVIQDGLSAGVYINPQDAA